MLYPRALRERRQMRNDNYPTFFGAQTRQPTRLSIAAGQGPFGWRTTISFQLERPSKHYYTHRFGKRRPTMWCPLWCPKSEKIVKGSKVLKKNGFLVAREGLEPPT